MELTQLKPKQSKVYFSKLDKELTLRPWTVEDQIWLQQEYEGKIQEIFSQDNIDIAAICRCVYRLLEDKSDFKVEQYTDFDEDGNEIKTKLGGWKKMASLLSGVEEQMGILTGLTECIGVNMPEVDEIKKSVKKKKVKGTKNQ